MKSVIAFWSLSCCGLERAKKGSALDRYSDSKFSIKVACVCVRGRSLERKDLQGKWSKYWGRMREHGPLKREDGSDGFLDLGHGILTGGAGKFDFVESKSVVDLCWYSVSC